MATVARQSEGTTVPPVAWDQARGLSVGENDDDHGPAAGQTRRCRLGPSLASTLTFGPRRSSIETGSSHSLN